MACLSIPRGVLGCSLILATLVSVAVAATNPPVRTGVPISFRPSDPLTAIAFEHFYNLDYDRAVDEFSQVMRRHPDDPFAVNHLLTAILMRELYRMGALNAGEYADDSFIGQAHRPADPKAKPQIQQLVQQAEQLEDRRLKTNPKDVDMLYARGVTRAQFAVYTALVERAWFSALRNAVGARRDHEEVLALDPNYVDAKLVVGVHNYVMGSLPWTVKVAVALVGLSGNKEKGFQYLREAANSTSEVSVDAQVMLSVFLRREHRYAEALPLMQALQQHYPGNLLFALEVGNLLRANGQNAEAADAYRKIWQQGQAGHYPGLHYEMAALSLGNLLRSEKDFGGASAAYDLVAQVKDPDPEVRQKADLAAGEVYDLLQKRDLALKKYQAVVAENGGTPQAETARKHIKEPYRGA